LWSDSRDRGVPWAIIGGTHYGIVRLNAGSRTQATGSNFDAAAAARKAQPRYLVSFENKAEAQRFVTRWHYRPFRWSRTELYENGEGAPTAKAELLW
jgi:hypothetical protein